MRFRFALALGTLVLSSHAVAGYSTPFASAENPLDGGGDWVDGGAVGLDWNNPLSVPGRACASVLSGASGSRYDDSIAILNATFQPFGADQYAEATVYVANGYSDVIHEVELLLRFSIDANDAHGYEVLWGLTGYLAVVRWNGPVGDYLPIYDPGIGSIPVPRDGDVLRAEMTGNIITVKLNGTDVASVDVSTVADVWPTGQPGIGFWPIDNAIPENYCWRTFAAGSQTSQADVPLPSWALAVLGLSLFTIAMWKLDKGRYA